MAVIENNKLVGGGLAGALIVGAALIMGGAFGHNFIPILVGSGVAGGGLVLISLKVRHHWRSYQEKKNIAAVNNPKLPTKYCGVTNNGYSLFHTQIGKGPNCVNDGGPKSARTSIDQHGNGAGIGNEDL